jgi:isoquinoline 1-oxidoreductase subunit beta
MPLRHLSSDSRSDPTRSGPHAKEEGRLNMETSKTRRSFLIASGISASFLVGCSALPAIPKRPQPSTQAATGWISLTPDGQWRLYSPRMEMGQNILSSLREVAAVELGISAEQIQVQLPSTDDIALVKATVGSDSLRELCVPLASACFALRAEIMRRATSRLPNSNFGGLEFLDGFVQNAVGNRIALKDLAAPAMSLDAKDIGSEQLKFFKATTSNAYIAKLFVDGEKIARGQPLYAADIRIPGMLYACVLRSPWVDPALGPSNLLSWNEVAVRSVPGFHSVVIHPLFAGPALIATRISAIASMQMAAQAKWSRPVLAETDPVRLVDIDRVWPQIKTDNTWNVDLRVDMPLAAHAFIEPRCAVAQPHDQGIKLWTGTQDLFYVRDVVSRDLGLKPDQVQVQAMRIGGAFGGKTIATVEREAALIAKAVGKPVKVQWSRADEFQAGFHRQPTSTRIRARLDTSGMIVDWQHHLSTSHVLFTNAVLPMWMQRLTNIIGDDGAARGQTPIYGFTRQQLKMHLTRLPVFTGPWRGLGAGPNVLAIEIAMDQAAAAAQTDPVEFRLKHLAVAAQDKNAGDAKRAALCLQKVIALAQKKPLGTDSWSAGNANSLASRRAFTAKGVACGAYKAMSYAAAMAQVEVTLNASNELQSIVVKKLWCTHDCGRVIDAQGVLGQVQGNLVWTLGMVLLEQLDAPTGTANALNFSEYAIARITDVPPMEIELIESIAPPSGAGETAMVAGAGAIANAAIRAMKMAGLALPTRFPLRA